MDVVTNANANAAQQGIAASLAVVQAAGAMSLDLSMGEAGGATTLPSPMAMSPWASEACTSPWSPMTPAVNPMPVYSPGIRIMSPTLLTSPGFSARAVHVHPTKIHTQVVAGPVVHQVFGCPSPGTQIRQNAISLGIPLNLRSAPAEVCAPVPVRVCATGPVLPSPTTRQAWPTMTMLPGAQEHPPAFLRHIVTPLTASRPRRAAGGA
jgi:hypothetical protein